MTVKFIPKPPIGNGKVRLPKDYGIALEKDGGFYIALQKQWNNDADGEWEKLNFVTEHTVMTTDSVVAAGRGSTIPSIEQKTICEELNKYIGKYLDGGWSVATFSYGMSKNGPCKSYLAGEFCLSFEVWLRK